MTSFWLASRIWVFPLTAVGGDTVLVNLFKVSAIVPKYPNVADVVVDGYAITVVQGHRLETLAAVYQDYNTAWRDKINRPTDPPF